MKENARNALRKVMLIAIVVRNKMKYPVGLSHIPAIIYVIKH